MKRWAVVGLLCAWVLWYSDSTTTNPKDPASIALAGFETLSACRDAALRQVTWTSPEGETVPGGIFYAPSSGMRAERSPDGKLQRVVHVRCLPGEADPRPRYKE